MAAQAKSAVVLSLPAKPVERPIPCLVRGCNRPAMHRGLCTSCRQLARNAVNRGEVTDEKLVELKLLLPRHDRPGPSFTEALQAALAAERACGKKGKRK